MSEVTGVDDVYSALEESAQLMGAPFSHDKVRPVLTAFGDALAEAGIVFSVSTGERNAGELNYTITVPPDMGDPYALARSNGLVEKTDHPVSTLLSDIEAHCPVSEYPVDFGVVGGLNKIYAHFPRDLQPVSKLAGIPSMPRALGENAGFFARHGLEHVAMIGVDHQQKTINVYFTQLSAECLEAENILSMLREVGLPEPNEQKLEFAQKSFRIYTTLSWESSKIDRLCFAPPPSRSDPLALDARISPEIEQFMRNAPRKYTGERITIAVVKWSPGGETLSLGSYYQLSPMMRKLWMAIHNEEV